MILFNSNEVAKNKDRDINLNIQRLSTVNQELFNKREQLKKIELEFEQTLNKQREKWTKEQAENMVKIGNLNNEIRLLEERIVIDREDKDFDAQQSELKNLIKDFRIRKKNLDKKEEDFEEKLELLEEKLSKVSEKEQEIDIMAKTQLNAQKGIIQQREQVSAQAKEMANITEKILQDYNKKSAELVERENFVTQKMQSLDMLFEEIEESKESIKKQQQHIYSQQATLKAAFAEAKKKKII